MNRDPTSTLPRLRRTPFELTERHTKLGSKMIYLIHDHGGQDRCSERREHRTDRAPVTPYNHQATRLVSALSAHLSDWAQSLVAVIHLSDHNASMNISESDWQVDRHG